MKANFMFAVAALMLSQNVIASPIPGDDLVAQVEPIETEVHRVEGQELVEVHHGRFRVRLNFKDHNSTSTVSATSTETSTESLTETSVPTVMSSSHQNRTRNRGGRS